MDPVGYGRGVVEGHSIREGLDRGYEFGFTSGGEHEDVGVTAVCAEQLTREDIFHALKRRHTYGTTGARIGLDFRVNGYLMGESIVLNEAPTVTIKVKGTAPIKEIQIVRDGAIVRKWNDISTVAALEWTDDSLNDHLKHYCYVVFIQTDDEMAWASPVFVQL